VRTEDGGACEYGGACEDGGRVKMEGIASLIHVTA
jgi:hypothetical protein